MKRSIDAKGLACPQPVILCRKAMAEAGLDEIEIVVDNEPARQNVIRFLRFTGAAEPVVASRGDSSRHFFSSDPRHEGESPGQLACPCL